MIFHRAWIAPPFFGDTQNHLDNILQVAVHPVTCGIPVDRSGDALKNRLTDQMPVEQTNDLPLFNQRSKLQASSFLI